MILNYSFRDTGVLTSHVSPLNCRMNGFLIRNRQETFAGRASWGATFGNYTSADGNGHGTHVACVFIFYKKWF